MRTWIKAIHLVDQLQHHSLHLVISTSTVIKLGTTDCINFIGENDTSSFRLHQFEQLPDHMCILVDVLDKLGANDTDEGGIGAIGHWTYMEGFACLVAHKGGHLLEGQFQG